MVVCCSICTTPVIDIRKVGKLYDIMIAYQCLSYTWGLGFGVLLVVHTHTDLQTIITRVKQVRNLHVLTSTDWPNDAKTLRRELSIGKC